MEKRSSQKNKLGIFLTAIFIILCISAGKAQNESDPFYWKQDTLLLSKLDTVSVGRVIAEINTRLNQILSYCSYEPSSLLIDSITTWNQTIRWAVIMNNPESASLIDHIAGVAGKGVRGQWQFYFVYMTLWASYHNSTGLFSDNDKTDFILEKLNTSNGNNKIFYEDRLLDLGPAALPSVIAYARENIIPGMIHLEKEMLSEKDLDRSNSYFHFVDLVNMLIKTDQDKELFRALLKDKDANVQHFATDVLENSLF